MEKPHSGMLFLQRYENLKSYQYEHGFGEIFYYIESVYKF